MKRSVVSLLLGLVVMSTAILIALGYQHPWTGFGPVMKPDGNILPAKTLWNWLELAIVPLFIALAVFFLNASRKSSEQRIEADRQRQKLLDEYIECITRLLLRHNLRNKSSVNARGIARTRTLMALRLLDPERKARLLQLFFTSDAFAASYGDGNAPWHYVFAPAVVSGPLQS